MEGCDKRFIIDATVIIAGGNLCYDARENLPDPCPVGFYGENCYEIEWKVQGQRFQHSICEDCKQHSTVTTIHDIVYYYTTRTRMHYWALLYYTTGLYYWYTTDPYIIYNDNRVHASIGSSYEYCIIIIIYYTKHCSFCQFIYYVVGAPCQAPITYSRWGLQYRLLRSNNHGVCYAPNPIYHPPTPRPYIQKQESAKAANSVSLCEEGKGCKKVPDVTGKTNLQCHDTWHCIRFLTIAYHLAFWRVGR